MGNNYVCHHATIIFGKPVTRKTVDVSGRKFRQSQIVRAK